MRRLWLRDGEVTGVVSAMIDIKTLGGIYLASPFSDDDPAVRTYRYDQAKRAAVMLLNDGATAVYSPIAMLGDQYDALPKTWEFWKGPSLYMLSLMESFVILTLPGWDTSIGITAEIKFWRGQAEQSECEFPDPLCMYPSSGTVTQFPIPRHPK